MTSPLLVRAAAVAQVLVDDLEHPQLEPGDLHHLTAVLRVSSGESVIATDGCGSWRQCEWNSGATLSAVSDVCSEDRPTQSVAIAFALLKGDKSELVVQKLTEIGVDRIIPMMTARTIVRWDTKKRERGTERLRRVAREAAMQSRRVWLPEVADVQGFDFVLNNPVSLAHPGGDPLETAAPVVAIGPEGGWSDDELKIERPRVDLGPTILRAETAAVSVAARLCALREKPSRRVSVP